MEVPIESLQIGESIVEGDVKSIDRLIGLLFEVFYKEISSHFKS